MVCLPDCSNVGDVCQLTGYCPRAYEVHANPRTHIRPRRRGIAIQIVPTVIPDLFMAESVPEIHYVNFRGGTNELWEWSTFSHRVLHCGCLCLDEDETI